MIYFHLKQSKTLEVILSRISRSFSLNQLCNDVRRDDDACLVVKLCVKFGELAGAELSQTSLMSSVICLRIGSSLIRPTGPLLLRSSLVVSPRVLSSAPLCF